MNKFEKLVAVDVSHGVESKGGLDYLAWAVAWQLLKERHPEAMVTYYPWHNLPDGSVMTEVGVSVDGLEYRIQLPVMNHRSQAIQNPNARDISDAQQRAMVKAIAYHGLGIGLYQGAISSAISNPLYSRTLEAMADGALHFHEFVNSLDEEAQKEAFNSGPTGEKTALKQKWRDLLKEAEEQLKASTEAIVTGCTDDDTGKVLEAVEELSDYEKGVIWLRLDEGQKSTVREVISAAKEAA